jgi:heme A synthase
MSDNEKRSTIWREATAQFADHVELAALELRYEARQAKRRAVAAATVLILVLTGFILVQAGIILSLMRAGLPAWVASFVLGGTYLVLALVVYVLFGRRDKRAGPPFQGTQRELGETLRWIQNLFS